MNPAVESISAFFPCYNDEATIASMVNLAFVTIDRVGADGEVIVIDDGSTDASPHVLKELSDEHPRLRVVTHERNRGYGGALLSGFASATEQWVFYTDGDAQFDPAELEQLVDKAGPDVDVVQGYKIRRADNLARRVIGRVYHLCVARIEDRDAWRAARAFATAVHYGRALTQQPGYHEFVRDPCPEAEAWAAECVSLPCFPEMTDDEIEAVCRELQ